ncbi:hypothetical protein NW765_013901 [Fusarium oxysporum]|nr:hypothetical protein NW765_013901 [Fusarium oxysporum]KAJ4269427.1 hypothetical protein NW764_014207 [Fusarium oxysporum]
MAIATNSSKLPAFHSPSPKQHGNIKKHDPLPPLPVSPYQSGVSIRRHTATSSNLSTPGTSRTPSRIPTPMTSRESSSSPPLKSRPEHSSSQSPPNTQSSKIEGKRRLLREKVKGKSTTTSLAHDHMLPVLHISKSSISLISDTGEGYDFGLSIGRNINHTSSQYVDDDRLDRMIEEKCVPLRKELAKVTQDLLDLEARVATLEANPMEMQKGGVQPQSVAEPQTARQKEKSPQKGFQPLIYASTSETAQVIEVIPESSKLGQTRNDTQEASSDVQDTIKELREENDKLRNKNRELEEKLRAHRSENVDLINAQEETKAENEQLQPSAQQCDTNPMDLDQEASGPSNPRKSGQNGDSSSQQEVSPAQQVSFEMIQRLSQEQEPFENAPDPDDMVTEVHTNEQTSEAQVQDTAAGNNPLIETNFAQRGPTITQQDIPLAQDFRGPSVAVHNTVEEHSHEVSRLREEDIVQVQPRRARRDYHRDMSIHEERALQTRSRRRRRHHRSSHEERYPDDPIRIRRSQRRHRCRSEWERDRDSRITTRHQRGDGNRKRPFIVRVWKSSGPMFFPDKYRMR